MKHSVKMTSTTRPSRGEIWIVGFDPTSGHYVSVFPEDEDFEEALRDN